MTEGIKFLNEEYRKHGLYFKMALNHIIDIGWRNAEAMEKADIEAMRKNLEEEEAKEKAEHPNRISIMSIDLKVWICEEAHAITQNAGFADFLAWIEVNKPFNCQGVKAVA